MTTVPQFAVPEIFVDHQEDDQRPMSRENASEGPHSPGLSPKSHGRESRAAGLPRIDTSLQERGSGASTPTEWSSISPSLSPRRVTTHIETEYDSPSRQADPGSPRGDHDHSRENSAMSVDDMMQSLGDSAWGESIRRSFTQRRSREFND